MATRTRKGTLLEYMRSPDSDEKFAKILENIVKDRERSMLRKVHP